EVAKCIPSDDEDDADGVADVGAHGTQRVDGVGRPRSIELDGRDRESRDTRDRELDHPETVPGVRQPARLLVWGDGRRDEADLVETLRVPHLERGAQMPQMDRV